LGEAFANPAMQKIAWEISSDSMAGEHLHRRSLQWDVVKSQNADDQTEAAGARCDALIAADQAGMKKNQTISMRRKYEFYERSVN
jgi:hypothetical protein